MEVTKWLKPSDSGAPQQISPLFDHLVGTGEQCRRHGLFMAEIATAE
jgi:hypothetical protein